jgi:Putative Flp pilus-assembly TadE/G-like
MTLKRFSATSTLRKDQAGQALVLGMFMILAGLLGLYFMFNAGQVVASKTRLVTATDAAAYSAAIWRARALNFAAYTNRAIVAQEVAVAQAVTLVSYAKFIETFTVNTALVGSSIPGVGQALATWATTAGPARIAAETAASAEIKLRADNAIGYKALLEKSQALVLLAANTISMSATANEVVKANDSNFFAHAILGMDVFEKNFLKRYSTDDERQRLKGVVTESIDPFVKGRDGTFWPVPTVQGSCFGVPWPGRIEKNGGTAMTGNGLERWEAVDTSSIHTLRNTGFMGLSCRWRENLPLGWGAAEASANPEHALLEYPGGALNNRVPASLASAAIDSSPASGFDAYSGISRVYDLDYEALNHARYPTRRVAIYGQVLSPNVRTADAIGASHGRLAMPVGFAGGKISAVSAAEIYFRRPAEAPDKIEYASLYNPFWQVRLVNPTLLERATAELNYVKN